MLRKIRSALSKIAELTGRILKTDGRYLLTGGFWSFVGQGSAAVSSLVIAIVIARYVPKDVYGNYKYVLAIVGFFSIFALNNIGGAMLQSVARGFDGSLFDGFRMNIRWSIAVFISAIAVACYYAFERNLALAFCVLLGGCITPLQNSSNLFINFLAGKLDFARRTIYADVLGNIVPALALIVTAILWPNLIALICAYFVSNLAIDFYSYLRIINLYKPDPTKADPEMRRYGIHLSAIGILGGIAGNFDSILLFHFIGAAVVAIYAFSIGILDQVKGLSKMLDSMMQARFAQRGLDDIRSGMRNKMIWMLIAAICIIVVFWFAAPYLYAFLFPAYTASIPYARLYSFNLLGLIAVPIGSYFSAHKKIREQYIANVGGNAIIIVFMFVCVIFWGLWGLIAARLAASFVTAVLSIILYIYAKDEKFAA